MSSFPKLDMSAIRLDTTSSCDSFVVTSAEIGRDASLVERMRLLAGALCDVSDSSDDVSASQSLEECVTQFERLEQEVTQYFATNQNASLLSDAAGV